ncbi:SRPBCC domain-containing protein [Streptomyces sp. NPDC047123]|uniref:SRPBCC family protein n=1 Tax=Streptomyces sp. NPDC047123 TaxID=3155622 RepID=UPI0034087F9C
MSVITIDKDLDSHTLTLTADFAAAVEQVWQLWADPRQLERWWGPPSFPATFEEFDLTPGGDVTYYMTSPEGELHRGWWRVAAVRAPTGLDFTDGFADQDGQPDVGQPVTTMQLRLTEHDGGTRMELLSAFDSREQMEKLLHMGMADGLNEAVGQMDALLVH